MRRGIYVAMLVTQLASFQELSVPCRAITTIRGRFLPLASSEATPIGALETTLVVLSHIV